MMRLKSLKIILCLLLVVGLSHPLLAQVSVTAQVSPQNATLEDELVLTVTVKGSKSLQEPRMPSMPAFKVVSSSASSSIQIINGTMDSAMQYNYILIPLAEGNFTIDPIVISLDGKDYQSQPLQISIGKSAYASSPPANNQDNQGGLTQAVPTLPAPVPTQKNETRDYWITGTVSKNNPYFNEQILYVFRLYTRIHLGNIELQVPEFSNLGAEEVVPEKKYYEEMSGHRYMVSEKVISLFPLKTGELSIPPARVRIQVPESAGNPFFDDPFFGSASRRMKVKNLATEPLTINVRELPPPPDNFTGLVGYFTLESSMDPVNLLTGETSTLTYKITGNGNVKDAQIPALKNLDGFKIYEDKPVQDIIRTERGLQGSKTFKLALVPLKSGQHKLEPITYFYFNPDSQQYEKLVSEEYALEVKENPNDTNQMVTSTPVEAADANASRSKVLRPEDIATIHTDVSALSDRTNNSGLAVFFYVAALALPPLIYLAFIFLNKSKKDRSKNQEYYRRKQAYKKFKKTLDSVRISKDPAVMLDTLMAAVKDYFGDQWGLYGSGLTVQDITSRLDSTGVDRQKMKQLVEFFSLYEAWKYGGLFPTQDITTLVGHTGEIIKVIDRRIDH